MKIYFLDLLHLLFQRQYFLGDISFMRDTSFILSLFIVLQF